MNASLDAGSSGAAGPAAGAVAVAAWPGRAAATIAGKSRDRLIGPRPPRLGSEVFRPPDQVIQQRLVGRVVGRQLDPVDRPLAALELEALPPVVDGPPVGLADLLGPGGQDAAVLQ